MHVIGLLFNLWYIREYENRTKGKIIEVRKYSKPKSSVAFKLCMDPYLFFNATFMLILLNLVQLFIILESEGRSRVM